MVRAIGGAPPPHIEIVRHRHSGLHGKWDTGPARLDWKAASRHGVPPVRRVSITPAARRA
jgi:hypothetical protein